jgi:preprotein translocase subunit SecB
MADQDTDNGAIENDDAAFEARIVSQYIRDLSFESPSIDRALDGPGENPNLELEVNVNARSMRNNMFQSEIEFKAHAVDDGGTIYQLEATYGGVFQVGPVPREALEPFLLVNCPSMLFPFPAPAGRRSDPRGRLPALVPRSDRLRRTLCEPQAARGGRGPRRRQCHELRCVRPAAGPRAFPRDRIECGPTRQSGRMVPSSSERP